MNDEQIISAMISFIEDKEKELQIKKMIADNQSKSDIVNSILNELERMTTHENN